MRHHNNKRKFGREKNQRNALMKGLALSLIEHESILTTEAKAKELRPYMEKLVTLGLKDTLATKRLILGRLYNNNTLTTKLMKTLAPRFADRNGGYTRITKLAPRLSDASKMAVIEFV
jgi:large subunit ribosomal protein L17